MLQITAVSSCCSGPVAEGVTRGGDHKKIWGHAEGVLLNFAKQICGFYDIK